MLDLSLPSITVSTMTIAPGHPADSFLSVMDEARIPAANHQFIRSFTRTLRITHHQAVERDDDPYVIAPRPDGKPDLHIHYGFTTGFTTEEEIIDLVGAGVLRDTSSRKGTWYVAHPVNKVRPRGTGALDVRRKPDIRSCGMRLPLTGICESCG